MGLRRLEEVVAPTTMCRDKELSEGKKYLDRLGFCFCMGWSCKKAFIEPFLR